MQRNDVVCEGLVCFLWEYASGAWIDGAISLRNLKVWLPRPHKRHQLRIVGLEGRNDEDHRGVVDRSTWRRVVSGQNPKERVRLTVQKDTYLAL